MEYVTLSHQLKMPILGLGVFQVPDKKECQESVYQAIKAGYRLIDTAASYMNEDAVGLAVKQAIKDGICTREELFITSKLWVQDMRTYEDAKQGIDNSLQKSGLEYFDLYLLHQAIGDYFAAWRAMEDAFREGKLKAIGVSNFRIHHLESLMKSARIMPMVNQIECTLGFTQQDVIDYCQQHDIVVEGWSPLGSGRLFTSEALHSFAKKYEKSAAQITLRYLLEKGVLPLPKSTNPQRMKENLDVFDFVLEEDDIARMDALTVQIHSGNNPDTVNF